jgi:hypothetical protein
VLELCLRGAANNFTDKIEMSVAAAAVLSSPAPRLYHYLDHINNHSRDSLNGPESNVLLCPSTQQETMHHVSSPPTTWSVYGFGINGGGRNNNPVQAHGLRPQHHPNCPANTHHQSSPTNRSLEINLPRSKSPILDEDTSNGKRRSAADGSNDNKRPRKESPTEEGQGTGGSCPCRTWHYPHHEAGDKVLFQKLHTALKESASSCVLECILDRCDIDEIKEVDDLGRLPLHLAAQRCDHPEPHGAASAAFSTTTCAQEKEERTKLVELIKNKIWGRYKDASTKRDYLGRLPIHLALTARSDCRVIELLLDANPSSGVEHCDTVDYRYREKLPIEVAADCDCDLSTMYLLLRVDPSVVQTWE